MYMIGCLASQTTSFLIMGYIIGTHALQKVQMFCTFYPFLTHCLTV